MAVDVDRGCVLAWGMIFFVSHWPCWHYSMNIGMVTTIGFVAAALKSVAFVPQVVRIWQTRSARDISGLGTTLLTSGVMLWGVYGLAIHSVPVILANFTTFALNLSILGLKIFHDSYGSTPSSTTA